jgi:hypothetical protein
MIPPHEFPPILDNFDVFLGVPLFGSSPDNAKLGGVLLHICCVLNFYLLIHSNSVNLYSFYKVILLYILYIYYVHNICCLKDGVGGKKKLGHISNNCP